MRGDSTTTFKPGGPEYQAGFAEGRRQERQRWTERIEQECTLAYWESRKVMDYRERERLTERVDLLTKIMTDMNNE